RGDRDNVIGVLYAKDLCGLDVKAPGFRLEPLLRPPTFVPVSMRAGDVFRELRRKVHLALVVDEYGGIAGLVTMEDLLGELFGDVADEYREAPARCPPSWSPSRPCSPSPPCPRRPGSSWRPGRPAGRRSAPRRSP